MLMASAAAAVVVVQRTFDSMILFSGHATNTKHSISAKFASFAGFNLPTLTVYDFLWAFFSRARRWDIRGRYEACGTFNRNGNRIE